MDYKTIIKNRKLRLQILKMFDFVPDPIVVRIQYRIKTGRRLNLKNAKRYTEKIQYYKLYYRDVIMQKCVDKFKVREYVRRCGYEEILNPIVGVYNNVEEINFESLPNEFVIKDTLGWGGTSVIIVKDKNHTDLDKLKKMATEWIRPRRKHPGREWVYDKQKNRILIDTYIPSNRENGGLVDYKFFCFQGKVRYLYLIADRTIGERAGLAIYDRDFNRLPYFRPDEQPLKRNIKKPDNYEKMIICAEKLSKPFPHARIDLYDQDGKIIFGEITFFDGSGYMKFEPDEFDFMLGDCFILPETGSNGKKRS